MIPSPPFPLPRLVDLRGVSHDKRGGEGKGSAWEGKEWGGRGGEGVRECKGSYVLNILKLRGIGASSAKGKKASVV